ncbi:MAG: ATP-binding protein [Deltaproteobacteria bacterium]|nr:ATP-binding protein [Deltaproteobacteria bacterium]
MGDTTIQDQEKSKEELIQELKSLRRTDGDLRNREFERVRGEQAVREQLRREVEEARREADELRANTGLTAEAAEALRQAKKRAEAATRVKSEFLANMSHELRTPMTAILGYTELLLEDGDLARAPMRRIEALRTLKRNGQHLMRILTDILDLSKIEAGKIEVEHISTSPCEVVADIESVMRGAAEEKGIRFEVIYVDQIPSKIETDPTRLRQILMNLVGNAIKFTEKGSVKMRVQLEGEGEGRLLCFAVVDTGRGLSSEAMSRIFESFSQADASTTREFGGTGLGLTISRQLARLLGGDITVESVEGEGSTFRLTIQAGAIAGAEMFDDPSVQGIQPFVLPSDPGSTMAFLDVVKDSGPRAQILLVEDGEDNRRLISLTLKKSGFDVTLAENGEVGLQVALAARDLGEPFDLILMDMQMPVMDGYEATRRLREAGCDLPIVALTAHAMKGDRERCLEAGCDDFATKPISRRDLLKTVLAHLRKPKE